MSVFKNEPGANLRREVLLCQFVLYEVQDRNNGFRTDKKFCRVSNSINSINK